MPDRVVHVCNAAPSGDDTIVTSQQLQALLDSGLEVFQTIPGQSVTIKGRKHDAVMMILRPAKENRGLTIAGGEPGVMEDATPSGGRSRSLAVVEQVVDRLSRALALNAGGTAGHLGAPGQHNMPGLTIISGEQVARARDMGQLASRAGQTKEQCPFPSGSAAASQWLKGWVDGQVQDAASPDEVARAAEQGRQEAITFKGLDVEVYCPYPPGTVLRTAWLRGFQEAGGTVE